MSLRSEAVSTITSIALVIVTAGLVAVGIWGVRETHKIFELSERAWVSAISMTLASPPESGKPIRFLLNVVNTGHEPALDVHLAFRNGTVDSFDPAITDMLNVEIPTNTSCSGLVPVKDRAVIAPSMGGFGFTYSFDSGHADPQLFADERIVSGSKFYVVNGCIAYVTFNVTRYSSFCYIMVSQMANVQADNTKPAVMQRIYPFMSCAKGFNST